MFDKDTYLWVSPYGEMFDARDSDHNGAGIHNQWAIEFLAKDLAGDALDKLLAVEQLLKDNNTDYAYELLEAKGWVRYLPWVGEFSTLATRQHLYSRALKDAVWEFCTANNLEVPDMLQPD